MADVSNPADVQKLIEKTVEAFGKLDIVVNNGEVDKKVAFVDYPLTELQKILAVNLGGPFLVSQAAARQMIKQGHGGRIVNISSVHEDLPMPTNAAYCVGKGGLGMLTRTIAVDLAKDRISLNRWGKPEEIAGLAVFQASDEAAYITGFTCFIYGGMLQQAGSY